MDSIINYLKDHLIISILIGGLLGITVYSVFAVLINKLHSAKYGKTTGLAWVPGINTFLLGSLAIHWIVGIILIIGLLFGICISFNIPYLDSIKSLLPQNYVLPYIAIYMAIILIVCIIGKMKLNKMVRDGTSKEQRDTFLNKDYDDKEPEVTANNNELNNNPVNSTPEMIRDNFQYNIPTSTNNDNNEKQNPQ